MIRAPGLALLCAIVLAAPAQAGILAPEDAAELAQSLAEAQEEQGICYGWAVGNNFDGEPDLGSGTGGPGVQVQEGPSCKKGYLVLNGDIYYACESCEEEDRAMISIDSNLSDPPTVGDLEDLGLKAGDLTANNDDTTLVNMVNALPLLAADRGNAPYVAYEPATAKDVPAADGATDSPGSDVLRDSWFLLVLCGALILAAPAFYLYKRSQQPAPPAPPKQQPDDPSPAT